MTKRKPLARDRDIADAVLNLAAGKYEVVIEEHCSRPIPRAEGSLIIFSELKRFRIQRISA